MTFRIVTRSIAYLVFVIALLATAIVLNHRQHEPANLRPALPLADEAALARCKALGTGAERDAACTAAWRVSRERFLNGNAVVVDGARTSVPAASDPSGPASGAFAAQAKRAGQPQ
jgi:conjugative transfer region protein TrbK